MAVAAVVGVLLLVYLLHAPPTLDLAAQVARATLFHDHGSPAPTFPVTASWRRC